ncbi:MAG TPA: hypothetical protein VG711_07905 [Phycisphaerales bacterium]|nr:hypothetical protein [Phycisphaerales bacterium]
MKSAVPPQLTWLAMALACLGTIIFATWSVRRFERLQSAIDANEIQLANAREMPPQSGVEVLIRSGGREFHRHWTNADIPQTRSGKSIDSDIPAGPFELECTMTIDTGAETDAYLGAEIAGCSVIIWNGSALVLADQSDDRKTVMSKTPAFFEGRWAHLKCSVKSDGASDFLFRPLWQPLGSDHPRSLPIIHDSK